MSRGYDASLDKIIKEEKVDEEYRVAITQYDNNREKIVIQKWVEFTDRDGQQVKSWSNKVGRLTKETATKIVEVMQRFLAEM